MTTTTEPANAFQLASMAECGTPESSVSPGADFLRHVQTDVQERVEWEIEQNHAETIEEACDSLRDNGGLSEIADSAVPIYTHTLWATFVDLAAYQEDPSELGADSPDMQQSAGICLYLIAERLAYALAEDMKDNATDTDTEENDR